MTNLARLIQKDKEAFSCIEEIVSMGGSFKVMETVHLLQNTITGVTRTALPWYMRHSIRMARKSIWWAGCDEKDCVTPDLLELYVPT